MSRLFWMGVGAAVGVYVTRRITETRERFTPAGFGADIADGLREIGAGLGAFGAEVRAGMTAREQELNELVARGSGGAHVPTWSEAVSEPSAPPPRSRAAGRARRAGA